MVFEYCVKLEKKRFNCIVFLKNFFTSETKVELNLTFTINISTLRMDDLDPREKKQKRNENLEKAFFFICNKIT